MVRLDVQECETAQQHEDGSAVHAVEKLRCPAYRALIPRHACLVLERPSKFTVA